MMLHWVLWLAGIVLAYCLFVEWRRSKPREVYYHTFWSRVLNLLANHMQAITLWNLTLMLVPPPMTLSPTGELHENTHVAQYARWPYTFPFRYLWELLRKGYDGNVYEEEARLAAGEPLRSSGGAGAH